MISLLLSTVFVLLTNANAQEYPLPVSEYAEQTGPTTMTFLSYPKFYRNAADELVPVDTSLRLSSDPNWDYEVTTGIWTLRARTDGTYQAEHEGDVFTYRLADIGMGRGEAFRSMDFGAPDWSRVLVLGDRIRWNNVFPDVDFEVRYIHDIMKVDVILAKEAVARLRDRVAMGSISMDDDLTVKFDIVQVMIIGEARQNEEPRNLYDDLDIDSPLQFYRNDRFLHEVRPVEAYYSDDATRDNSRARFDGSSSWRLNVGGYGVAEMSIPIERVDRNQQLIIDPSMGFQRGTATTQDTLLKASGGGTYGSHAVVDMYRGDRLIFGFNVSALGTQRRIDKAILYLHTDSATSFLTPHKFRAYKISQDWTESAANRTYRTATLTWSTPGGTFESLKYASRPYAVATTNSWFQLDVSQIFKSHFTTNVNDSYNKGFLVKWENETEGSSSEFMSINMSEHSYPDYRPELVVHWGATQFGAYLGNPVDTLDQLKGRMIRQKEDFLPFTRYLDETEHVAPSWIEVFMGRMNYVGGIKGFIHTPVGSNQVSSVTATPTHFGNHINSILDYADDFNFSNLLAIEIGGEEETKRKWYSTGWSPTVPEYDYCGNINMGRNFAPYYVEGWKKVKNTPLKPLWANLDVMSGGGFYHSEALLNPVGSIYGCSGEFLRGFIRETQDRALAVGLGKNDYLPETISIHAYPEMESPEYRFESSTHFNETEYFTRLKELFDICNAEGYIPNFAVTEYGFSVKNDGQGPTNASETSQAVYYARFALMNATMMPYRGIGWKYNVYWTFPQGEHEDVSFFSTTTPHTDFGADRAIRYVARALFNPTASPALGLQSSNMKVWVPLQRWSDGPSPSQPNKEGYAWCGWETNGQKWGAIWRYYSMDHVFGTYTPTSKQFRAPSSFSGLNVSGYYRFNINGSSTQLQSITGTVIKSVSGNEVIFTVSPVTNNPLILKFN